jgi:hypothetical protein
VPQGRTFLFLEQEISQRKADPSSHKTLLRMTFVCAW